MNHHSRFDQLVAATEELIHENERMRTKYTAFEAALQEVVDNQRPYGARDAGPLGYYALAGLQLVPTTLPETT